MNIFWREDRKEITKNLQQDLDENYNKVSGIINKLKQEGTFFDYIGILHDDDAIYAMDEIHSCLHKKYELIFKDYGVLLSRNNLFLLIAHIEKITELAKKEFAVDIVNSPPKTWTDEMGVAHNETMEERQAAYRLQCETFAHNMYLQKIRTLSAFHRRNREKINRRFEIWTPIAISIFALVVSVVSLFIKKEGI